MSYTLLAWLAGIFAITTLVLALWGVAQRRQRLALSATNPTPQLATRSLIETAIAVQLGQDPSGAVVFIDMDDFKPINDQFGKNGGDKVLATVSSRLKTFFGEHVYVCRYCSDEFIAFIPSQVVPAELLADYLERLQATLSNDFTLMSRPMSLTASIGYYRLSSDTESPTQAIQAADIAMGESKRQGGAKVTEFSDALWQQYQRELTIKTELQLALNNEQLVIFYQPIVDCISHDIVAVEALVRWPKDSGFVAPSEFVAVAERSRQIVELNQYILRQAVKQFAALPGNIRLSVNIPASQLHATDLVADVKELLETTGLPSQRLYLELTETELVTDSAHVLNQLQALRALGVGIALDDFGTGYSNLQYLKQLPVDIVKLDRSFIDDIGDKAADNQLTGSILDMLRSLDKYLIVEGIENLQQAEYLRTFNVNALQGFYFHKPMPLEALRAV
ncbi:hypothetical protein C5610_02655 [Idiomarina sp. OT37-5b]|jgi:diguanylate cyclase (GGDEF)-like protein|uniref:putative bifunctional diguanylate cyclase/phosphodiesterase n=1 Tax=Idiomarina sp. OT37-5b TaxID=2100422 RepID=UPI000CFA6AA1|nr:bifunctional diguanylate cyclase/phosphodiesterase [Idiomarina sp. OT37-5b]AVJ55299.1 hypothetical protein C5610_02655 [Idiomarina sp. OT37-5b]